MKASRMTSGVAASALIAGGLLIAPSTQAAQQPAKIFQSCDMLHKKYPAGVAKNAKAARRAVRDGHSRPSTTKAARKTYRQNNARLDRDRDGTACED